MRPDQPDFGPNKPDSQLYFPSVRKPTKAVTTWLNKITGGSDVESGVIDISPETIDHFIDTVSGGTGRFIANIYASGFDFAKGDMPEPNNMPFVRQLLGAPSEYSDSTVIRDTLKDSLRKEFTELEINRFKKAVQSSVVKDKITAKEAKENVQNLIS